MQGDVNGDGLDDAVAVSDEQASGYPNLFLMGINNRDGTFSESDVPYVSGVVSQPSPTTSGAYVLGSIVFGGDFNGDGRFDFLVINGASYKLFTSAGAVPDVVTKIEQGVGLGGVVQVTYTPLAQMGSYGYVNELKPVYPQVAVTPAIPVVSQVDMANGVGGAHTVTYRYGTALSEHGTGRGFLGFNWVEHTDGPSLLTSRTYFRQDWPYLGQIALTAEYAGGSGWTGSEQGAPVLTPAGSRPYLKQQVNTYSCLDISVPSAVPLPACQVGAGKRYFVYASNVVASGQDLDGTVMPTEITTQTLDGWGNPLTVKTQTSGAGGSFSKTTTNTYSNDTTNWYLGRLLKSTVTATQDTN